MQSMFERLVAGGCKYWPIYERNTKALY